MTETLRVLLISAVSESALLERLLACVTTLGSEASESAREDAAAWQSGCEDRHRVVFIYRSTAELRRQLDAALRGDTRRKVARGVALAPGELRVAFVFTGQGAQHWSMGGELFAREPVFRDVIERCDALVRRIGEWSLTDQLYGDKTRSQLSRTETRVSQVALLAVQAGLAALWRSFGVEPAATIGHSAGEIAAAHVAGALDLDTAVQLACVRGELMQQVADSAAGRGAMAAVQLGPEEVVHYIGSDTKLCVAAHNAPRWVTVSGPADSIAELAKALEERRIVCRILHVPFAAHSDQVDGIRAELEARLVNMPVARPWLRMYSTVTGRSLESPPGAEYWGRNLRCRVRLAEAVGTAITEGVNTFVEVGPHPALTPAISDCIDASGKTGTIVSVSSLARDRADSRALLASLAALHVRGQKIGWNATNLAKVVDFGSVESVSEEPLP
jgi:acyl transferase domain-containing protein